MLAQIAVKIPQEAKDQLTAYARASNVSLSDFVRDILLCYLEEEEEGEEDEEEEGPGPALEGANPDPRTAQEKIAALMLRIRG